MNTKQTKKEYDINYRINNRDKIRERRTQKMTCDCGVVICKGNILRHKLTSKHFLWEQNNLE